jgi:glycosyltransferase involved in cell wall biosynthesis
MSPVLACQVPAGFAGGLAEFVIHRWNGYLVNPEAANLIQAVLELASDRSLRLRMGENARRLAEGYPESLWKQRWNSLLNRILANNQEGGG